MRHLVNAYEVEAGTVKFAGNTVWSVTERFWGGVPRRGAISSVLTFTFTFTTDLPSTEGKDPAGRDRPGYELSRTMLNDVLRTERLGRHAWKLLHRWKAPDNDENAYWPMLIISVDCRRISLNVNTFHIHRHIRVVLVLKKLAYKCTSVKRYSMHTIKTNNFITHKHRACYYAKRFR